MLCVSMFYCVLINNAFKLFVMLCYVMLCYAMLCYVMLCYVIYIAGILSPKNPISAVICVIDAVHTDIRSYVRFM